MNTVPSFPQGPSLLSTVIEQDFDSTFVKIGTLINDNLNSLNVNVLISPDITVGTITITSNRISSVEDPILDHQVGTKSYVDNKVINTSGPVNSLLLKDGIDFVGSSSLTYTTSTMTLVSNSTINANTATCYNLILGLVNIYANPEESYSMYVPSTDGASNSMLGINSSNILTFYTNTIPSGSNEEIQFNNSGSFGSDPIFKFTTSTNTLYANLSTKRLSTLEIKSDDIVIFEGTNNYGYLFNFPVNAYAITFPRSSGQSSQVMGIDSNGYIFWTNNGTLSSNTNAIQFNHDYVYDSSPTFTYDSSINLLSIDNLITQTPDSPVIINTSSIGFGIGKACSDLTYNYICLTNSIKVINGTQSLTIAITGTVVNAVVNASYLYVISQSGSTGYLTVISTSTFQQLYQKSISLVLTDLFVSGSFAYVIGSSSLLIIDISTPTLLTVATLSNVAPNATGVKVSGSYIYISCNNDIFSLVILERFYPYNVVNTTNVSLLGCAGLDVLGPYVYTIGSASSSALFNALDVSDPSNPVVIQTLTLGSNLSNIYVTDQYAYICSSSGTLYVINLNTFEVTNYSSSLLLSAKSILVLNNGLIGICTELLLNTLNTSILSSSDISNILVTDLKVNSEVYCNTLITPDCVSTTTNLEQLIINSTEVSVTSNPATIASSTGSSFIITITSTLAVESVLQITLNSSFIESESIILTSVYNCSNTGVIPAVNVSSVSAGVAVIRVKNVGLINFSGPNGLKIFCLVL